MTDELRTKLDEAVETAFADLDCGSDGLKKKESAEVLKTLYELELSQEEKLAAEKKSEEELKIKKVTAIKDACVGFAGVGISAWGLHLYQKNFTELVAFEDAPKVLAQRPYMFNMSNIGKFALNGAMRLFH